MVHSRWFSRVLTLNAVLVGLAPVWSAGCTGDIGDPAAIEPGSVVPGGGGNATGAGNGSGTGGVGSGGISGVGGKGGGGSTIFTDGGPGPALLRRLTREEYNNTVAELLGDTSKPALGFSPDVFSEFGFENDARKQVVTESLAEDYMDGAGDLAAKAVANLAKLVPCSATAADMACAKTWVTGFGQRVYRRPLNDAEITDLMTSYTAGAALEGFKGGIEVLLARMLQSPYFIYRLEVGDPSDKSKLGVVRLSSWEIASRLSYFLWASMPDDTLFAAAQADALKTPDQVGEQALRMLADARAHRVVARFHEQWLELNKIDGLAKDAKLYPDFTTGLREPLKQEALKLVEDVAWTGDGDIRKIFTAPYAYMNKDLATFLKMPEAAKMTSATTYQKIPLTPTGPGGTKQRMGILTSAGLLAAFSKPTETSPILRGTYVLRQLLCQPVPPPPPNINNTPPLPKPNQTTRQRYEAHEQQDCASCHRVMDPVGFALENFDTVGRWRTMENGQIIDVKTTLAGTVDINGDVNGAIDLAGKVAGSAELGKCMSTEWFRYALGRGDVPGDEKNLAALGAGLAGGNYNLRDMLVSITKLQPFMYKVRGVSL